MKTDGLMLNHDKHNGDRTRRICDVCKQYKAKVLGLIEDARGRHKLTVSCEPRHKK